MAQDREETSARIKREHEGEQPRPRKVARPNASSTLLGFDDEGQVFKATTPSVTKSPPEAIELD